MLELHYSLLLLKAHARAKGWIGAMYRYIFFLQLMLDHAQLLPGKSLCPFPFPLATLPQTVIPHSCKLRLKVSPLHATGCCHPERPHFHSVWDDSRDLPSLESHSSVAELTVSGHGYCGPWGSFRCSIWRGWSPPSCNPSPNPWCELAGFVDGILAPLAFPACAALDGFWLCPGMTLVGDGKGCSDGLQNPEAFLWNCVILKESERTETKHFSIQAVVGSKIGGIKLYKHIYPGW